MNLTTLASAAQVPGSYPLGALIGVIILSATALLILLLSTATRLRRAPAAADALRPAPYGQQFVLLGVVGAAGTAAIALVRLFMHPIGLAFNGLVVEDAPALLFTSIIAVGTVIALLLVPAHLRRDGSGQAHHGEMCSLMLFAAAGGVMMVQAADLIAFFVGLETLSLAVYALTAYHRESPLSQEAALKYFVYGAVASAVMLYGIALLYGAADGTGLSQLAKYLLTATRPPATLWIGLALFAVGLAFKIAAVPFHMWAPDAYEGAPTAVTAFMATVVKAAAFGALVRFVVQVISPAGLHITLIEWLAILTMTVGNLLAVRQDNLKRMLAYSSIAHAGYVLVGVAAALLQPAGAAVPAIIWYLMAYTLMTAGAFGVVLACEHGADGAEPVRVELSHLAGLGRSRPALALAMAICMFSLAGVPPLAGFFGKFYLFAAAVDAGRVGLVIVAVLNSVLAAYYYLRVTVALYLAPAEALAPGARAVATPPLTLAGLVIATAAIVVLGIVPNLYLALARLATGG